MAMTKTVRIMNYYDDDSGDFVQFEDIDPDMEPTIRALLAINHEDWMGLGSPQTITVSIEPGDKLNG